MNDVKYYLRLATDEGNNKAKPYNFGAVIVKDSEIVAQDFNHVHENNDNKNTLKFQRYEKQQLS